MPNHIANILSFDTDEVTESKINDFLRGKENDEDEISFENVIPSPEEENWYNWRIENWGTKWDAYDTFRYSDNSIGFNTAWNHPFPVVKKISEIFPDVTFNVKYADEDLGYNLGEYSIKNGIVTDETEFKQGSEDAKHFAMEIQGITEEDYDILFGEDEDDE